MLPKTTPCVKSYDGQTKWCILMIKLNDDWRWWLIRKNIKLFWIKSVLISKKNLIASLSIKKIYLKTNIKSHGDKIADISDKNISKLDSNYTCLAVISLDSALKKDDSYNRQVV